MQCLNNIKYCNNTSSPGTVKTTVNTNHISDTKNVINGLKNARSILLSLERSIRKTSKYEDKLLQCRSSHSHVHGCDKWWDSDSFGDNTSICKTETVKKSRSPVDFTESWSTMSIVCLQYQYEELSKRYSSLLEAYDERSNTLNSRDAAIARLRRRARRMQARLACAHQTLINIGEKYLALRAKGQTQKSRYKEKIAYLERCIREVVSAAEKARTELDCLLAKSLLLERDTESALLLSEIRRCNFLFLQNLRLKAAMEKLAPGTVKWNTQ